MVAKRSAGEDAGKIRKNSIMIRVTRALFFPQGALVVPALYLICYFPSHLRKNETPRSSLSSAFSGLLALSGSISSGMILLGNFVQFYLQNIWTMVKLYLWGEGVLGVSHLLQSFFFLFRHHLLILCWLVIAL